MDPLGYRTSFSRCSVANWRSHSGGLRMPTSYLPSTEEVAVAFTEEVSALGGSVSDNYDDGSRLFMRALLDAQADVRPGDAIRAGIALRTTGPIVAVHPYTYRQVCSNGA